MFSLFIPIILISYLIFNLNKITNVHDSAVVIWRGLETKIKNTIYVDMNRKRFFMT